MARPYGLLRAGFPFHKTLGMRRLTNFPIDVALGKEGPHLHPVPPGEPRPQWSASTRWRDEDLGEISKPGEGEGEMKWPVCIIADSDENLYVLGRGPCTGSSPTTRRASTAAPGASTAPTPAGSTARRASPSTPRRNVYVADAMNHRVQKFTKDGKYMTGWGGHGCAPGEFDMPYGVAVDDEGFVYVADWRNDRIQKFTAGRRVRVRVAGAPAPANGEAE